VKIVNWGRLLRLPNIFTVPGDPLVGFLIMTGGKEDYSQISSLLLQEPGADRH